MRPNNHLTHDARTSKEEQAVEARVRLMPSWIDITDITDVTSDSGEKIGKVRLREVHMRDLHSRTGSEATYIEHPGGARTEKPGRRPCNEGREDHKVPITTTDRTHSTR